MQNIRLPQSQCPTNYLLLNQINKTCIISLAQITALLLQFYFVVMFIYSTMYGYTSWIFSISALFLVNLAGIYGFVNYEKQQKNIKNFCLCWSFVVLVDFIVYFSGFFNELYYLQNTPDLKWDLNLYFGLTFFTAVLIYSVVVYWLAERDLNRQLENNAAQEKYYSMLYQTQMSLPKKDQQIYQGVIPPQISLQLQHQKEQQQLKEQQKLYQQQQQNMNYPVQAQMTTALNQNYSQNF